MAASTTDKGKGNNKARGGPRPQPGDSGPPPAAAGGGPRTITVELAIIGEANPTHYIKRVDTRLSRRQWAAARLVYQGMAAAGSVPDRVGSVNVHAIHAVLDAVADAAGIPR